MRFRARIGVIASPEAATLPAGTAFATGAALLATRRPTPRDEAERIAFEIIRNR